MFTFGFSTNKLQDATKDSEEKLNWFTSKIVEVTDEIIYKHVKEDDVTKVSINDFHVKLIKSKNLIINLKNEGSENVIKAEDQHSDLLPAIYEGGLKVWECSYDLGNFLLKEQIQWDNVKLLDLGCGSGVVGIAALMKGSTVHFQDYNNEVIESFTIPNVSLNLDVEIIREKCEFYSGDWSDFTVLSGRQHPEEEGKYDLIVTSETIYNESNHKKLFNVFKERLKAKGTGFVAGKTYYFGVGGGMRQFQQLVENDGCFNVENVWKSVEGVQREIIKLTWKQ